MEQKLKQRLVGAIVLISLAVIFIPIILEGPDDEWTPRSHSIPEPPQMDYGARLQLPKPVAESAAVTPAPLPPQAELEAEVEAETETETEREAQAADTAAVEAEQTEPPATPAVAVSTEPVVADTPPAQAANKTAAPADTSPPQAANKTAAPPAVASQPDSTTKLPDSGWVIQVGSFSSERNANSLRDRLRISGYDSSLQDVAVGQGRMYRVVVGPLQERQAAEQLREKLENEMQLRGIVVGNKG